MADQNNSSHIATQNEVPPEGDSYLPSSLEGDEVFGEGEEVEFNEILSDSSRYQTTGLEDQNEPEDERQESSTDPSYREEEGSPAPTQETTPEGLSSSEDDSPSEWTEREKGLLRLLEQAGGAVLDSNRQQTPDPDDIGIVQTHDFIGDLELDDLLDTKEGLNNLLNKVYQAGVEASARSVMRRVPEVINSRIERHQSLNQIAEGFYRDNPDLANMKRTVALVAQEIVNNEPEIPMSQLLERAGVQTRSMLGIRRPRRDNTASRSGSRNPGFVNGSGARQPRQSDNRTEVEKEIDELLNF